MNQDKMIPCNTEMPLPSDQTNIKHKTESKKRKEAKKRILKDKKEEEKMRIKIETKEVEVRFD